MIKLLKKLTPKGISARFYLILALPIALIQVLTVYIFWVQTVESNFRELARNLVQKIEYLIHDDQHDYFIPDINLKVISRQQLIQMQSNKNNEQSILQPFLESIYIKFLKKELEKTISLPSMAKYDHKYDQIIVEVFKDNIVYIFETKRKRMFKSSTFVFIILSLLLSFLLLGLGLIFMKNQLRPIKSLTKQVKQFSRNRVYQEVSPSGSSEIKLLIASTNMMQKRISGYIADRNLLLAAISHDLRTPLTKLMLHISLLDSPTQELEKIVADMERIIQSYISFMEVCDNNSYLDLELLNPQPIITQVILGITKFSVNFTPLSSEDSQIEINVNAFKRVLENILSNCKKYASNTYITIYNSKIVIEDDGIGCINYKEVLKPFFQEDSSRSINNHGVGLGLSIAEHLMKKMNGFIKLDKSSQYGGLKVVLQFSDK
jgi:two-component system osmolarity sensor histidine kinase EnvZ